MRNCLNWAVEIFAESFLRFYLQALEARIDNADFDQRLSRRLDAIAFLLLEVPSRRLLDQEVVHG